MSMIHGWWFERMWEERTHDFDPLLDANGKPMIVADPYAGENVEYGVIKTTTWRCVALTASTIGPEAPSFAGTFMTDYLYVEAPGYDDSNAEIPGRLMVSKLDGPWKLNGVTTSLSEPILGIYTHSAEFRSGHIETRKGTWSEIDIPSAPIDVEPEPEIPPDE